MPSVLDHIFVFFFAVYGPLYTARVWFPRFLRDAAAGVPGLRLAAYRRIVVGQLVLASLGLLVWAFHWRTFSGLGLGEPRWERFAAALVIVGVLVAGQAWQGRAVLKDPARCEGTRARLGPIEPILPHTNDELRSFLAVGLVAGVGEEILYRGYLLWYLGNFAEPVPAILISSVVFGLAHTYQGRAGVLRTGIIGLVLAALYVLTGALYASMLLHALINFNGGRLGYRLISSCEQPRPAEITPPEVPAS